uniref:Uncharacterized protein n=1 Tax=Arundo donax TaxID=35708 RepID=A0A0A9F9A9_ARUDO
MGSIREQQHKGKACGVKLQASLLCRAEAIENCKSHWTLTAL